MDNKTNKERLATIEGAIINIDKNVDGIRMESKEQWKAINKNSQEIASHKSIIKIIEGFMTAIVVAVVGLFIGKYK